MIFFGESIIMRFLGCPRSTDLYYFGPRVFSVHALYIHDVFEIVEFSYTHLQYSEFFSPLPMDFFCFGFLCKSVYPCSIFLLPSFAIFHNKLVSELIRFSLAMATMKYDILL